MDRYNKQTKFHTDNTRGSVPVHGDVFELRSQQPHNYKQGDRSYKRNRHHKYLPAIILCLTNLATAPATLAETVGGVSATRACAIVQAQSLIRHSGFTRHISPTLTAGDPVSRSHCQLYALCNWGI